MNGRTGLFRIMALGGWRAYTLAAAVLIALLVAVVAAGIFVVTALAVGAIALVAYRALRAFGLARPDHRRTSRPGQVIEGEYKVVERRLPEP